MSRCELDELPEPLCRLITSGTVPGLKEAWDSRSADPCDLRSHGNVVGPNWFRFWSDKVRSPNGSFWWYFERSAAGWQLDTGERRPLGRLDMLGAELEAAGGILDRVDYRRVRRLGVQLRSIPRPSDNWDLPPSSLQGWIASYQASVDSLRVASECGLLKLLQAHSEDIRSALSLEMIPAIEREIADMRTLEGLVASAREHDAVRDLDLETLEGRLPSQAELARVLVVQLGISVTWPERPKVDERTGLIRLKVGALLGQVALGGALAIANLALGVVGGIITSIPSITSSIPLSLGLIGSTYTGFNGLLSGIDKLTDALKEPNE